MRRLLVAGAVVALFAVGLVTGPAARADSYSHWCAFDNWPTTTEIVDDPSTGPYLAIEWYNSYTIDNRPVEDETTVNVCYSDTPGATPSSAVGGVVQFHTKKITADTYQLWVRCYGDSPAWLASVNCNTETRVTTSSGTTLWKPSATVSASGWLFSNGSTLSLGTTGASTGTITETTHADPYVTYGGTCATVAGVTPPTGTSCSSFAFDADVAKGDEPTVFGFGPTSICLVNIGGCWLYLPSGGVVLFNDTANDTQVTLFGTRVVDDPGRVCVGSGCPTPGTAARSGDRLG